MVEMYHRLEDRTVSPYKPVSVAYGISEDDAAYIEEHERDFPGVVIEKVWRRHVVRGTIAPHLLGFINEINADELKEPEWKGYQAGDIIGKAGIERVIRRVPAGATPESSVWSSIPPEIRSENRALINEEDRRRRHPAHDRSRIQKITQNALASGVNAARGAGYQGRSGAAVVMDPNNGEVLAAPVSRPTTPRSLPMGTRTRTLDASVS